jgi:RNA polymerase sigma factor (sigma-70 family)
MSTTETPGASETAVRPRKLRGPRHKRSELTAAQQDLAAKYIPLAQTLAKMVKMKWMRCHDELDSAAYMALVEAAQAFEPRRGVKFATFARFRIIGALYDIQRILIAKEYPRHLPNVPRPFHFVPGDEERSMLMLTSPDAPVGTELEAAEEVERWFRSLPPRHARACREIYVHHLSQNEAAEAIGRAKSRVSHMHAEALDMLRELPAVREAALAIGLDVGRN